MFALVVIVSLYLSGPLLRSAVIHFPKISRELLMLPASLSLSPKVFVLLHLSEPARSQRENLREKKHKQKNHSFTIYVYKKRWTC